MIREEFARKIRWPLIIWLAGLVNMVGMLPQLFKIIQTKNVEGLALEMFVIYLVIQIAFSLEGYFTRNRMLMICFGLSAFVSSMIISAVLYLRHFG